MSYNASALVQLTARQQHDDKALNNLLTLLPLQGKTKIICIFLAKLQFPYRQIYHQQSVTQVIMVKKAASLLQVEVQHMGHIFAQPQHLPLRLC